MSSPWARDPNAPLGSFQNPYIDDRATHNPPPPPPPPPPPLPPPHNHPFQPPRTRTSAWHPSPDDWTASFPASELLNRRASASASEQAQPQPERPEQQPQPPSPHPDLDLQHLIRNTVHKVFTEQQQQQQPPQPPPWPPSVRRRQEGGSHSGSGSGSGRRVRFVDEGNSAEMSASPTNANTYANANSSARRRVSGPGVSELGQRQMREEGNDVVTFSEPLGAGDAVPVAPSVRSRRRGDAGRSEGLGQVGPPGGHIGGGRNVRVGWGNGQAENYEPWPLCSLCREKPVMMVSDQHLDICARCFGEGCAAERQR
ncbi:MAG: hypothetical protein LQ351_006915 [Letrouitia transgressa]|nr:MAG: hypothetical protein LQ351_006915 [Letrouitia transgressa]